MDEDDQKEGLFRRLKNIANAQKQLIRGDDNKSICYRPRSEFDEKEKMDLKPLNVFDYLNSFSQKAENLMNEIKYADHNTDDYNLLFIGSNKEKFKFNIFKKPLNFLSAVFNGEITLKKAEIKQRDLEKKYGS